MRLVTYRANHQAKLRLTCNRVKGKGAVSSGNNGSAIGTGKHLHAGARQPGNTGRVLHGAINRGVPGSAYALNGIVSAKTTTATKEI
jgi:hypothetical protein